jgi:hypothetical protein
VIAVISDAWQSEVVEEFFQLFKVPWERYRPGRRYDAVLTDRWDPPVEAALHIVYSSQILPQDPFQSTRREKGRIAIDDFSVPIYSGLVRFPVARPAFAPECSLTDDSEVAAAFDSASSDRRVLRVGYDLFEEVRFLLTQGQPPEFASVPSLDLHIEILRRVLVGRGVAFAEIVPAPPGSHFMACLTHDVDFANIRDHVFDHTMWGFLYRATIGSLLGFIRGRVAWSTLLRNWKAAASLPLIHLGLATDFWRQFDGYRALERELRSTFFLIPFPNHPGTKGVDADMGMRAARYDVTALQGDIEKLVAAGNEIAVHGLDAWHDGNLARIEQQRIAALAGSGKLGIRMHWLYFDEGSPTVLDAAGYSYDSTCGYNETVGYRAGTTLLFRPLGAARLLEVPLHIQDVALFSRKALALTEEGALGRCERILAHAETHGGAVTFLWHMRSVAPERCWDAFYSKLLDGLRSRRVWVGTARDAAEWFGRRRSVMFEECERSGDRFSLRVVVPPGESLCLRVHVPGKDGSGGATQRVDIEVSGRQRVSVTLTDGTVERTEELAIPGAAGLNQSQSGG